MGPTPKYRRNLHAVSAHFRRAGAMRDRRASELERVVLEEIAEERECDATDADPELTD
jgi:hypothetical protein